MAIHFGSVTAQCAQSDVDSAVAGKDGAIAWQIKDKAMYPWDTQMLVPNCVGKTSDNREVVLYKTGTNVFVWISVGLVGFLFLILIIAALKGHGGNNAPEVIYR